VLSGTDDKSTKSLYRIIEKFNVTTIVIIDYEKLYNNLLQTYGSTKTIIKFTKSGGVEHKNDREAIIHENLHHYF